MNAQYKGVERRASPAGADERNERLETAMREFEALALAVHHDFRVPLAAIEGASRVMGDHERVLDRDVARAVRAIRDHLTSMRSMTANLLELSRLSGQKLEVEMVDKSVLVREAWLCVRGAERVRFSVGTLPQVRCHRGMFKLVWTILLSQAAARCARVERGLVQVTGGCGGEHAIYGVRDNGRELDLGVAGKLCHVFEKIQEQSTQPGVGVGLAIVQRIVTRHGGSVWAEARPDDGALVQFSLPARE